MMTHVSFNKEALGCNRRDPSRVLSVLAASVLMGKSRRPHEKPIPVSL